MLVSKGTDGSALPGANVATPDDGPLEGAAALEEALRMATQTYVGAAGAAQEGMAEAAVEQCAELRRVVTAVFEKVCRFENACARAFNKLEVEARLARAEASAALGTCRMAALEHAITSIELKREQARTANEIECLTQEQAEANAKQQAESNAKQAESDAKIAHIWATLEQFFFDESWTSEAMQEIAQELARLDWYTLTM